MARVGQVTKFAEALLLSPHTAWPAFCSYTDCRTLSKQVKTDSVGDNPISGKGDDSEAGPKMVLSPSMAAIHVGGRSFIGKILC